MDNRAALWILAFGVVSIQAFSTFRPDVNWPLPYSRNTRSVEPRVRHSLRRQMYDDEIDLAGPKIDNFLRVPGSGSRIAEVATDAAEAAMAITRSLARDLSESAAIAVAEAVVRILSRPRRKVAFGSRSINTNSNYNLNLYGQSDSADEDDNQLGTKLIQDPSRSFLNYGQDLTRDASLPRDIRWKDADPSLPEWNEGYVIGRDNIDLKQPCGYKSMLCPLRRAHPIKIGQLKDEATNVPKKDETTPEIEEAEFIGHKDLLIDGKELDADDKELVIDDKELVPEPNATTATDTSVARRSKNKNVNQNHRRSYRPVRRSLNFKPRAFGF